MRYYTYDTDNYYTGFFEEEPNGNYTETEPTSEDHILWNSSTNTWDIPDPVVLTFKEKQKEKIKEARAYFDEYSINFVADKGAEFEKDTWETQRTEYMPYQDDNTTNTPYIDMLSATRGITKSDLIDRIGINVVAYAQVQGNLHKIEDAINVSTTQEELDQAVRA